MFKPLTLNPKPCTWRLWQDTVPDADEWERRTPELIALLAASAPQLRILTHWYPWHAPANPAAALPAALGRLSQLTSLALDFGRAPVSTAQVDAMLQMLPLLQHLELGFSNRYNKRDRAPYVPLAHPTFHTLEDGFPLSIATVCTQLRDLQISDANFGAMPPEMGRLTALTRLRLAYAAVRSMPDSITQLEALRELDLSENGAPLVLPRGLGRLTALTRLRLKNTSVGSLPASMSQLSGLRELDLGVESATELAQALWHLTGLTKLQLDCSRLESLPDSLSRLSALAELQVTGSRGSRDAGHDLALPDGLAACRRLTSLALSSSASVAASPVLARLHSLRQLSLTLSAAWPGQQPGETHWTQLTGLTSLYLSLQSASDRFMPRIGGMTGLRRLLLILDQDGSGQLPGGPYLGTLKHLLLGCSPRHPAKFAANLAAATQLTHLFCYNHEISLTSAEIAVLSPLPALKVLQVAKPAAIHQRVWDARVVRLERECCEQGHAPPTFMD